MIGEVNPYPGFEDRTYGSKKTEAPSTKAADLSSLGTASTGADQLIDNPVKKLSERTQNDSKETTHKPLYDIFKTRTTSAQDEQSLDSHPSELEAEKKTRNPSCTAKGMQTIEQIRKSFAAFTEELETEIFKFYELHEQSFDDESIHGRMHIARAVCFCEAMAIYLHQKGMPVDFSYARYATAMHDAGREGNGFDRWEKKSSKLLYQHLLSKGMPKEEALQKSRIISKSTANKSLLEFIIFQSADCLDIMRPCTLNGGRKGFNPQYLAFLIDAEEDSEDFQFRQELIEEAWELIKITENLKHKSIFKVSIGFMSEIFNIIKKNPSKFKILSSICCQQ